MHTFRGATAVEIIAVRLDAGDLGIQMPTVTKRRRKRS